MRFHRFAGPVIAVLLPLLLFEVLRLWPSLDMEMKHPQGHFYIVSSVAFLAMMIAVAVGVAGRRMRNIEVSFLSLAFISLAEMFMVHGISTPGLMMNSVQITQVSAQLSLLLASIWLCLSAVSSDHPVVVALSRWNQLLVPIWTISLSLFAAIGLLFPSLVEIMPLDRTPLKPVITVITITLNAITMYRYYQSYLYSRFPLQACIIYSSGWLLAAQIVMATGKAWMLSWWIYHYLLLASMLIMIIGLVLQYAAKKTIVDAIRALFTNDPIERITYNISPSVKALILATENKDPYTAGHNFRVTMYALRLAEEMQVSPEWMRALAQGSIVHDVGKINVPDAILNKPAKLTDEERSVIELHPVNGYNLCRQVGFMKEELEIIRSHHERWDGTGYPDRLKGEQIPLLARIVAVADVYDALTSNRSYRQARSHMEAIVFLNDHKGTHFDPACVDAWTQLCVKDPQAYQYPASMIQEGFSVPNKAAAGAAV